MTLQSLTTLKIHWKSIFADWEKLISSTNIRQIELDPEDSRMWARSIPKSLLSYFKIEKGHIPSTLIFWIAPSRFNDIPKLMALMKDGNKRERYVADKLFELFDSRF